jgi:hypothetical protein
LHTLQAALLFLQMQLTHIFQEQLHLQAVAEHKAPLTAPIHILKIETHNPRWRLSRNWDILNSIKHPHTSVNWYMAQDNSLVHQHALQTANTCIMGYKAKYSTLTLQQQPTLEYGLAYLHHGGTIINKQYDKEIAHAYNWPKFTKYCCEKFLWNTKKFQSVNWKAFQHQGKKLDINQRTHLHKYVYKWLPIRKTLVHIDSSASPICLSCSTITETHNHIFKCKNINRQQITNECIVQIDQINRKWEVPTQIAQHILSQLTSWTTDTPETGELAAINLDHTNALQTHTNVGWGCFLKGFIATELQNTVNTQTDKQQNAFEQIRWSCEMIQCVWDSEAEHWKCCNRDKHSITPVETDQKKQEKLLMQAQELLQTKPLLPPCYKTMFASYAKLEQKTNQ